ncbi:MAG: hypothetical protein ACK5JF_10495 [Oscillospiraceae bacterium]
MENENSTLAEVEEIQTADASSDTDSAYPAKKRPARYNLYDRMKLNVSEKVINAVIIAVVLLIIAVVIYGIAS